MSEQEKMDAIPVEGEVETKKKEGFFKRMWHNEKVRKGLKCVGRIAEGAGLMGLGFLLGRYGVSQPMASEPAIEGPAPAAIEQNDDILDEE